MMENKKMRAEHPKKELAVDILYDIIAVSYTHLTLPTKA